MARSAKKGPFVDDSLLKKVNQSKQAGKREVIKTGHEEVWLFLILLDLRIAVHDGRKFVSVYVTENMVGIISVNLLQQEHLDCIVVNVKLGLLQRNNFSTI